MVPQARGLGPGLKIDGRVFVSNSQIFCLEVVLIITIEQREKEPKSAEGEAREWRLPRHETTFKLSRSKKRKKKISLDFFSFTSSEAETKINGIVPKSRGSNMIGPLTLFWISATRTLPILDG